MDFPGNSLSDAGKLEQIVSHFFPKALHIVLESRIPSLQVHGRFRQHPSATNAKKSDKWFNLVMGDRSADLEKLHSWHRKIIDCMIIDIILVHPVPIETQHDVASAATRSSAETLIERWVVQYENPLIVTPQIAESSSTPYQKVYKKSIILLRSLYSQARLLPAYRVSRQLSSSRSSSSFDLIYKVSSFSDVFSGSEGERMKEYHFVPVEVPLGRLCVSVTYRSTLSDFNLGAYITLPPRIITDYVGSPTTDPFRYFLSPVNGVEATSVPLRATRPLLSGSSERPHSWTSGFHKLPPTNFKPNQSLGGILISPSHSHCGSTGLYDYLCSRADVYNESYRLSPPFSSSASPSTPRNISGSNSPRSNSRPGTAPVTIPSSATSNRYVSSNLSDPSRNSLPPFSPKGTKHSTPSRESLPGIALYRSSISRESPSGLMNHFSSQKVMKDSKFDSGRFSGVLSSSGSPRFGFSRSPSRLSSQDDLDDPDCSCPFDFDDIDVSRPQPSRSHDRRKSSNLTTQSLPIGRKSQDAAVGVLVQILRTAPPLRQDSSCYISHSGQARDESRCGSVMDSEFSVARTIVDALEELRTYKELKDLLLSKN